MKRVLITVLLLVCPFAWAGNELGNGGDSYAQEFAALGRRLVEQLKAKPDPRIAEGEEFEKGVEKTKISTKDKLHLGEVEVDAINYPDDYRIELNRSRWKVASPEHKTALVLHEYLGISKIDDHNYQISSTYTEVAMEGLAKPTKLEFQLRSGYTMRGLLDGYNRGTSRPDIGGSLAYRLNQNWALGLGVDSYRYGYSSSPGYHDDTMKYTLFGKYSFRPYEKLRPFVSLGGAYFRYSYSYQSTGLTMTYESPRREFGADLGFGLDYVLSRSFNIGLSVRAAGDPTRLYSVLTSGALGMTFLF